MCLNTHIRCVSEISTDERGDKPQPLKILQLIVMIIMASGFVSEQLLMIDAFGIHDQRLIQHHRFIGKRCAINKQSNFGISLHRQHIEIVATDDCFTAIDHDELGMERINSALLVNSDAISNETSSYICIPRMNDNLIG